MNQKPTCTDEEPFDIVQKTFVQRKRNGGNGITGCIVEWNRID